MELLLSWALKERQGCNRWWGEGSSGGRDSGDKGPEVRRPGSRPTWLQLGEAVVCERRPAIRQSAVCLRECLGCRSGVWGPGGHGGPCAGWCP